MNTFIIASTDYVNNNKALFKKKSENQNYISFDNSLKINGNLYIGGLKPASTTFKLKFPQNREKVGFYFGINGTNQGHVLNMDLENTDESIKAFCDKINGLGNRFNPDDCFIPGNGTLEASFERFSETDVNLSLSLYTSKEMQYGNGMYLFGGDHWQTQEPQFTPWDDTVLPEGPLFSGGGTPTNYSLTVNGSPLKEFKSIEENTSGVHIANNFDISNSNKETLLSVNDTKVVVGKNGAISTIVDIGPYEDISSMRITSGSKRLNYHSMHLEKGIDHIVDVINGKAATTIIETYSNNFKVTAKKLSSTEFSLMLLDDGLTVGNCSGAIGQDYNPDTQLTFTKETSNFNMYVNGRLYDKNGREILGGGGGGGGDEAKSTHFLLQFNDQETAPWGSYANQIRDALVELGLSYAIAPVDYNPNKLYNWYSKLLPADNWNAYSLRQAPICVVFDNHLTTKEVAEAVIDNSLRNTELALMSCSIGSLGI